MKKPILALTLHQPWASLFAWKLKRFETRSWYTPYRGPLVIHAGKSREGLDTIAEFMKWWKEREMPEFHQLQFGGRVLTAMREHGLNDLRDFPMGVALCVANLVNCIEMTEAFIAQQTEQERVMGWWAEGRFAWQLEHVRLFPEPIPAKGGQQLWQWQGELPVVEGRS